MYQHVAVLAAFVLVYSAVAGRLEKTPISWPILMYSVLSLTVVRMLPEYLSLAGSSLKPGSRLLLGWFGPRGLVTVVFGWSTAIVIAVVQRAYSRQKAD